MKKRGLIIVLFLSMLCMTGCGDKENQKRKNVYINEYEKIVHETAEVEKGDITPTLEFDVVCDTFERKNYYPVLDEMEVDQIYVSEGDVVQKGDVLITFKSGDIEEQIAGYKVTLDQQQLLLEHYRNLALIDTGADYSEQIKMLESDIEITNLYISELNAKLNSYSIIAEGEGTVAAMSDFLEYGIVNSNNNIITVVYGTGDYYATVKDDYEFVVGEIYEGIYAISVYSLELIDVEISENEQGEQVQNLHFSIAMDGVTKVEKLSVTVEKNTMSDVLFVPQEAVFQVGEKYYVYTIDQQGFREAVEVTVGQTVDEKTIIESSLVEGDKVVIN